MPRQHYHIDIESRSSVPIQQAGADEYARGPDTEITLLSFAINDRPPVIFDLINGDHVPGKFFDVLRDPDIQKFAFNSRFEYEMFTHCWGVKMDHRQWADVEALGFSLSLPGGLEKMGLAAGLPEDMVKTPTGKALIRFFCVPLKKPDAHRRWFRDPKEHPEKWDEFKLYCKQDVVAERELYRWMRRYLPMTYRAEEHELWTLDQRINDEGLPVDLNFVDAAIELNDRFREDAFAKAKQLTGLDNPNSVQQLGQWFEERGFPLPNLAKDTLVQFLQRPDLPDLVRRVVHLRQQLGKSSVSKYSAFKKRTNYVDGRLRGEFKYMGASRTGRWAGRGVQVHNLSGANVGGADSPEEMQQQLHALRLMIQRGDYREVEMIYPSVAQALSSGVRSCIAAPPDKLLTVADLSSIETVTIGFLAECPRILNLFRSGKDAYKDYATDVFGIDYGDVTKAQRKFCKPPVLGCGFGLGAIGLNGYAETFGVDLSELFVPEYTALLPHWSEPEEGQETVEGLTVDELTQNQRAVCAAQHLVNVYRNGYAEVPAWWNDLKDAAFTAVLQKDGKYYDAGSHVSYVYRHPFLFCRLPSGRHLAYLEPKVKSVTHPKFGEVLSLSYMGKHPKTGQWTRIYTHKGKLAENAVQAAARDLLAHGLMNADRKGITIIGHVHDEIMALFARTVDPRKRKAYLGTLIKCLTDKPKWAEAMPVNAAGWVGRYYMKD